MEKHAFISAIVFLCVLVNGCTRGKQENTGFDQLYSNYMAEARSFVKEYRTGDIEVAQKVCLRDWALGIIKKDIPNLEQAYLTSMVFAAERLAIICESKDDEIGRQFWLKWRNENVEKINMTTDELAFAVYQLDKEMGVSYAKTSSVVRLITDPKTNGAKRREETMSAKDNRKQ